MDKYINWPLESPLVIFGRISHADRFTFGSVIPYEINQEKAKMFLTPSDFDKIWHTYWDYYEFQIYKILDL